MMISHVDISGWKAISRMVSTSVSQLNQAVLEGVNVFLWRIQNNQLAD